MQKKLNLIILILFIFLPIFSLASEAPLNLNYPEFGGIRIYLGMNLNRLIAWFYYFIIGISGLAAFVMLIWGGIAWMTSTGDPSKIGEAKDRIYSAFLGLIIILASYLILNTINPDLIMLNLPEL